MFVITADWHLGSGKNLGPDRNQDILDSVDQVIDYAMKKRPKYFIILGDIYHGPSPSSTLREVVAERIKRVSNGDIQVLIIPGNHDFANKTHALSEMKELNPNNILVIDSERELFTNKFHFVFFPHDEYIDSKVENWEGKVFSRVAKLHGKKKGKRKRIVLGHFPVVGSSIGSSNYIYRDSESVTKKTLKKLNADMILLGDIHSPQKLFNNCYYVGSVDKIDFGERKDQKSFIHITKKFELKKIKIKNRSLKYFIVGKNDSDSVKGAIVKPIINCNEQDVNKFNTHKIFEELEKNKAHFILPFEWNITERIKKEGRTKIKDINIKKYLKKFIRRNFPKMKSKRLIEIYEKNKIEQ